jgi:hypothetical protein
VLALGDATFDIVASRGLVLGGVFSPTLVPQGELNVANPINDRRSAIVAQKLNSGVW